MYDSSKDGEDCPRSGCSDETCCIKRLAATISHGAVDDKGPQGLPLWLIILIVVLVVLCFVLMIICWCRAGVAKGGEADPGEADNVKMSDRTACERVCWADDILYARMWVNAHTQGRRCWVCLYADRARRSDE